MLQGRHWSHSYLIDQSKVLEVWAFERKTDRKLSAKWDLYTYQWLGFWWMLLTFVTDLPRSDFFLLVLPNMCIGMVAMCALLPLCFHTLMFAFLVSVDHMCILPPLCLMWINREVMVCFATSCSLLQKLFHLIHLFTPVLQGSHFTASTIFCIVTCSLVFCS